MTRIVVFAAALLFILGFAIVTILAVQEKGFDVLSALSLVIVVVLAVGVLGALLHPPDR